MGEVQKRSEQEWPLQALKSNPQLMEHVYEEMQALPVEHIYHGNEKTIDEDEKIARKEVERTVTEYLIRRLTITEGLKASNENHQKRIEQFRDAIKDYFLRGKVYLLEEVFQASKQGLAEVGSKLHDIYEELASKFWVTRGGTDYYEKEPREIEISGKKIAEIEEDTREDLRKIPGGPQGPRSALGSAASKTDKYRGEVQGGSPQ